MIGKKMVMTNRPAKLRDLATRYTAAWCSGDAGEVAAFYAANASLRLNDGVPAMGREAIAAAIRDFMEVFSGLQIRMDDLQIQHDRAVYQWTLTATHGETGNKVRVAGLEVWRVGEDGLITECAMHFDSEAYERQTAFAPALSSR